MVLGQRVFTCAHSFHGFVYLMLPEMAEAARIKDHQSVGTSRIGGSRVIQHWDVADEKNQAKEGDTVEIEIGSVSVLGYLLRH